MSFNIKKFLVGLKLVPKATTTIDSKGELEVLDSDGKLYYHDGTIKSAVLTESQSGDITNKNLDDSTVAFVDTSDNTKKIKFDAVGTTGTSTTLTSSQTANRVLTLPDATDTLVGKATTDTLTNKSIDADTNTITNIENDNIKSGAAIDRNKLASGTNYRILANNSSGVMSENAALDAGEVVFVDANGQLDSESTLATSRGGTNISSFTTGDILYASSSSVLTKLPIGSSNEVLSVIGGIPSWQPAPSGTLPPGMMSPFAGSSAPTGWLICDGSIISQVTYASLFAVIGTIWNTGGEGAGNFRLPSMSRRTAVGSGGAGTGTLGNTVGSIGGAETLPAHTHSGDTANENQTHQHTPSSATDFLASGGAGTLPAGTGAFAFQTVSLTATENANHTHTFTTNSTGTGTHGVIQPSAVVTYIIKT